MNWEDIKAGDIVTYQVGGKDTSRRIQVLNIRDNDVTLRGAVRIVEGIVLTKAGMPHKALNRMVLSQPHGLGHSVMLMQTQIVSVTSGQPEAPEAPGVPQGRYDGSDEWWVALKGSDASEKLGTAVEREYRQIRPTGDLMLDHAERMYVLSSLAKTIPAEQLMSAEDAAVFHYGHACSEDAEVSAWNAPSYMISRTLLREAISREYPDVDVIEVESIWVQNGGTIKDAVYIWRIEKECQVWSALQAEREQAEEIRYAKYPQYDTSRIRPLRKHKASSVCRSRARSRVRT